MKARMKWAAKATLGVLAFATGWAAGGLLRPDDPAPAGATAEVPAMGEARPTYRSTWCPTPEMREEAGRIVTDGGATVEEVPMAIGVPGPTAGEGMPEGRDR